MRKKGGQPRFLILIFLVLAALMIFSAVFELYQSKLELLSLMEEQAHSLLESLIISSKNSVEFNEQLVTSYRHRLLNNARLVKILYEKDKVDNRILSDICRQNKILRINIFNSAGQKLFSSHKNEHSGLPQKNDPQVTLLPIFRGYTDSLVIGIKPARYQEGYRYAVAVAARNRSAIVINVDASELLRIRKETGFGILLRKAIENPGIIYAALQDTAAIIAASGNVRQLENIQNSDFLTRSLSDSLFATRTILFDTTEVLEAVHPLSLHGSVVGLFRLGLSLDPLQAINTRIYRRLVIITIILTIVGFLLFTFIFVRQRYDLLQKQYQEVETYSSGILHGVDDSIIVFDSEFRIKIFNSAAENLFGIAREKVPGSDIRQMFKKFGCEPILEPAFSMRQFECRISGQQRFLLVSRTEITESENSSITIIVLRDLTEQHNMERQMQRLHRLTAMGELASGVAHEIRNPLNTISTIIQQIDRDFEPGENREEYHELLDLVSKDIRRINQTIGDFLRFSRPDPLNPGWFELKEVLDQTEKQYQAMTENLGIKLKINLDSKIRVFWDEKQIRQVLMNLIQNAIDALKKNGTIKINAVHPDSATVEIKVKDSGPGMSPEVRTNIFNLYYTTKAAGTGIGLSMVQRIVYEHGGLINVNSHPGAGTEFIIRLPAKVEISGDPAI